MVQLQKNPQLVAAIGNTQSWYLCRWRNGHG